MNTEIVGARGGLADVMPLVQLAARTDVNVLVHGETGTGKELISHAIHRASSRGRLPFVVANCAAIPRELMESEMFGHVRGAYTGAVRDHAGYFEAAGSGTLLLDEIGDLHPELQAKILHVVENGTFRRVGSTETRHNRARLISATNRELPELIRERRFRADLYYRLDVLTIRVPPLRERRQDIEPLARHFLDGSNGRDGRRPTSLTPEAVAALQAHDWPGNVRELKNCVDRIVLFDHRRPILEADVRAVMQDAGGSAPPSGAVRPLAEIEREQIAHALRVFAGNRTRAAAALGISRRTLQLKLKRLQQREESSP